MDIALLGPLAVTSGGRVRELGGTQPRLLLALLALEPGRVVGTGRLAGALWGGRPPADPGNALQAAVSRLRRALAPDHVVVSRPAGYLLAVDPEQIDAVRFERLVAQARTVMTAGQPAQAGTLLRAALELWRGPALADFPEVPAARAAAERLEELRRSALEERIEADLALGVHAQVVGELQALVADAPLRERAHAQLMRALYAAGRQADALAAYQRAREVLADRAGLDPGPELRRLEQAILAQDPALLPPPARDRRTAPPAAGAAPADTPAAGPRGDPAPAATRRSTNLPAALTSFVGREQEVAQVRALLRGHRLVTLAGPGGAGKTRLAVETARRLLAGGDAGRDGAWLVDLAPLRDPALLPAAVLEAVTPGADAARPTAAAAGRAADATARLLRRLAGAQLLLVLDNCEHLVEAAAALTEAVLGACPDVRVLATSREALRVPGETRLPVPALPLPPEDRTDPAALLGYGACVLFVERARAVAPDFADGDPAGGTVARAVAEVCRRLDGLPLAIELAAARVNVLPVPDLAARLHDRFRLLTAGARTALPRHRTLRAVVDWSWELLTPAEQAALRRLAVFTGGCTLAAAEQVCAGADLAAGDVAAAVAGLVEKSLLDAGPGPALPAPWWPGIEDAELPPVPEPPPAPPRYRLLETVRAYAAEKLEAAGETDAAARAHAAWCVAEAEGAGAGLYGADQLTWRTRVHAEHGNLRAALRWLTGRGDADGAVRLAALLAWQWGLPGHRESAVADLRAALALPGGARDRARAEALATLALLDRLGKGPGRRSAAEDTVGIEDAVAAFRDAGAPASAELVATLERSLGPAALPPPPPASGSTPPTAHGDDPGRLLDAALAEGGWTHVIAWSSMLRTLTGVLDRVATGDLPGARQDVTAWVARLARHGDRVSMIDSLGILAYLTWGGGDHEQAEAHVREALRLACELRYPAEMAVQFSILGELELERGRADRARGHLGQALAAFRQLGAVDLAAWTHYSLSLVALVAGDLAAARAQLDRAADAFARADDEAAPAAAGALRGIIAAREGDCKQAAALHRAALEGAERAGDQGIHTLVLQATAVAEAACGRAERAAVLLGAAEARWRGALVSGRPPGLADQLPTRLLEDATAAARRALGDETFAAAMARGRALDPDEVLQGAITPQ